MSKRSSSRWASIAATFLGVCLAGALPRVAHAQTEMTKLKAYTGAFQVGGSYQTVPNLGAAGAGSTVMDGAMYVNYVIPYNVTHPYPIILIHGGVGTGQAFLSTPDGRTGWAQYLAGQGFAVYIPDQVARGRSLYQQPLDGTVSSNSVLRMEQLFTATQDFDLWPQAHLHTQWPGSGLQGDATFDSFMRGTNGSISNTVEEPLTTTDVDLLIDRIGPAIVLGRSQSGVYPFVVADQRPGQVKAMIDIEGGAPAINCYICQTYNGNPSTLTPLWGAADIPLNYNPPISDPSQLTKVVQSGPNGPNLATCWLQGGTVHTLPNLAHIPTMIMVSQSSFAAQTEQCMHEYLTQAGVNNQLIRLQNVGFYGNGHLMNVEKNSDDIAQFLVDWLGTHGL